jgi:hypothetical protein
MRRYNSPGGISIIFRDCTHEGDAFARAAYEPNYDRLLKLKNKYDPKDFFRMNQNIKPTV